MNATTKPSRPNIQRSGLGAQIETVAKRALLIFVGPPIFLFVVYIPLLCSGRKGFRGWYWRLVKRSCSLLLWFLSIRSSVHPDALEALKTDSNSIIACNHRSLLDGFVLMDVIPDEKWFTFSSKKELFDSIFLRTGFVAADLVKLDRSDGKSAMTELIKAVANMPARRSVVIFVEGTRSTSESLGNFKPGVIVAARESGRTVRPIVIRNSDQLMPRGRRLPNPGVIEVCVLPPFECDYNAEVEHDLKRLRTEMKAAFDGA